MNSELKIQILFPTQSYFFAMQHSYFRQKYQNKIHFNSSTKTATLSLHYHILTCLRVSLVKWKWISYSKLQHRKKKSLNVFKNLFLNSNGVNNFNYPVSVHQTFIYSCFQCRYLVITLLVIKGHAGMEAIPDTLLVHCRRAVECLHTVVCAEHKIFIG